MRNSSALKQLMARRAAVIVPGRSQRSVCRVIEDLGFECVYISGAGVANMHLGAPDVGLTTSTELADTVAAVADAVNLPLIVDADTGFGNAVNMVRTVRVLERMGAPAFRLKTRSFRKSAASLQANRSFPCRICCRK